MTVEPSQPVPVLFIGGVGRSGTTLVERTLDTDRRVIALGEVIHLWRRSLTLDELCGCGERFSSCPFWSEVGDRAFGGWSAVDPTRLAQLKQRLDRTSRAPKLALRAGSAAWRADLKEYAGYYARLYRAAADVSGADVVVDSSKQASLPFILKHDSRLALRVLHCVRDSRAVAYSWSRTVPRPEAQTPHEATMQKYSTGRISVTWMLHNLALECLRARGVPVLRLRYEDWVTDPLAMFEKTLAFCELDASGSTAIGRDWIDLPVSHTCSGNPMRFRLGRIDVRSDERWRHGLRPADRKAVTLLTAPLLGAYHYLGGPRV